MKYDSAVLEGNDLESGYVNVYKFYDEEGIYRLGNLCNDERSKGFQERKNRQTSKTVYRIKVTVK